MINLRSWLISAWNAKVSASAICTSAITAPKESALEKTKESERVRENIRKQTVCWWVSVRDWWGGECALYSREKTEGFRFSDKNGGRDNLGSGSFFESFYGSLGLLDFGFLYFFRFLFLIFLVKYYFCS